MRGHDTCGVVVRRSRCRAAHRRFHGACGTGCAASSRAHGPHPESGYRAYNGPGRCPGKTCRQPGCRWVPPAISPGRRHPLARGYGSSLPLAGHCVWPRALAGERRLLAHHRPPDVLDGSAGCGCLPLSERVLVLACSSPIGDVSHPNSLALYRFAACGSRNGPNGNPNRYQADQQPGESVVPAAVPSAMKDPKPSKPH